MKTLLLTGLVILFISCKKENTGIAANSNNQIKIDVVDSNIDLSYPPIYAYTFTATGNNATFSRFLNDYGDTTYTLNGKNQNGKIFTMTIWNITSPGSYNFGPNQDTHHFIQASYWVNCVCNLGCTCFGYYSDFNVPSGNITILNFTGHFIKGTFSFNGTSDPSGAGIVKTATFTNGSFQAAY